MRRLLAWLRDPFGKKHARERDEENFFKRLADLIKFEASLRDAGFRPWQSVRPPNGVEIVCAHFTRGHWTMDAANADPLWNVTGVWWKPWTGETINNNASLRLN